MNKSFKSKRSAASWLVELAKGRYGEYALSVLTALLGVACSLIPYFIIIRIITALVNGTAELSQCLMLCAWMVGFWVLRYALHSVSTSLSHHATFHVLALTRQRIPSGTTISIESPMRQSSINSSTSTARAPTILEVISGRRCARVVSMESTRSTIMFL